MTRTELKWSIALILFLLLLSGLWAQQHPAPPAYTPTELQRAHLHEAQLEAQLAQVQLQQAQQNFSAKVTALRTLAEQVKTENKWPADVTFNLGDLTFAAPPAPAPTKEKKP